MPLHEYVCPKCCEEFERIKTYAAPEAICPACGALVNPRLSSSFSWKLTEGHWGAKITRNQDYFAGKTDKLD